MRNVYSILVRKSKEDYLKELVIDGRVVLEYVLKKVGMAAWPGFICSRQGRVTGSSGPGKVLSVSIKGGEFLEELGNLYIQRLCSMQ
jgi:hypothetical protein